MLQLWLQQKRGELTPTQGLRRSGRIPKEIAILLFGSDTQGKYFSEETKTVLLSRHGAGIVSAHPLGAEEELILRRLDTGKEAPIRLVGRIGPQAKGFIFGVAFLDPALDFWGIKFPSPAMAEQAGSRFLLECGICKRRETVDHTEIELDVYAVNETILRYCKSCRTSTSWIRPPGGSPAAPSELEQEAPPVTAAQPAAAPVKPAPSTPAPAPPLPTPAVRRENRRKHVRTTVNFKACVRHSFLDEEIVSCEDISRGGLRFSSRKRYQENARIEVAAPYEPGAPAIFVPARIVRVQELPDGKFRCGVAYTTPDKKSGRAS